MGKKIKQILKFAAILAVAFAVGYFLIPLLPERIFNVLFPMPFLSITLILSVILQVIFHELGHLIAGKMSGYKLLWIGIFNTTFVKKNKRFFRVKIKVDGVLGHCLMSPPDMKNGKFPFVFYFLGGSLMNLLVSGIILVIYFVYFPQIPNFLVFAGVGIFLAVLSLVPMNVGGITNDGYDIVKLRKSEAERRSFWHLCRLYEDLIINDMRFRDMSEEQFALFNNNESSNDENQNNALNSVAEIFRLNWLFDRHEFEKAKALVENLLKTSDDTVALLKNEFICALLLLELIGECRKEEIERLYTKELENYIKDTSSQATRQLLLYAYAKLFLQNDVQATKALEKFNHAALSHPFSGEIEGSRELIEMVDKLAMERKNNITLTQE